VDALFPIATCQSPRISRRRFLRCALAGAAGMIGELWPAFDAASIGIDANLILDAKTEDESQNYPTIGDLIYSGSAQENVWYWVDTRNINLNIYTVDARFPEANKAIIIPPREYFSNYSQVAEKTCLGYSLKKIILNNNIKYDMQMTISMLHFGYGITPDENVLNNMNIDELQDGVHYFKIDNSYNIIKLYPENVAFLKKYHRINIKKRDNSERNVIHELIKPLILKYVTYEYHNNGYLKIVTQISESGVYRALRDKKLAAIESDDRDKYMEYTIYKRKFDDQGRQNANQDDIIKTVIHDRTSPYWLQNMLHD
jgi:hypothetical protein